MIVREIILGSVLSPTTKYQYYTISRFAFYLEYLFAIIVAIILADSLVGFELGLFEWASEKTGIKFIKYLGSVAPTFLIVFLTMIPIFFRKYAATPESHGGAKIPTSYISIFYRIYIFIIIVAFLVKRAG